MPTRKDKTSPRYAGAEWARAHYKCDKVKWVHTPFSDTVFDLLGQCWYGVYHLDAKDELPLAEWDERYFRIPITNGGLATWDSNTLTNLVILAHLAGVRLEIDTGLIWHWVDEEDTEHCVTECLSERGQAIPAGWSDDPSVQDGVERTEDNPDYQGPDQKRNPLIIPNRDYDPEYPEDGAMLIDNPNFIETDDKDNPRQITYTGTRCARSVLVLSFHPRDSEGRCVMERHPGIAEAVERSEKLYSGIADRVMERKPSYTRRKEIGYV